jgi:hypothetical protein
MNLSEHRVNEIFTKTKKKGSKNPTELNMQGLIFLFLSLNGLEFEEAMSYVQQKKAGEALNLLGLSTNQLIFLFILLVIILLLLFAFIFLGITALSLGGTFGSVINSLMPMSINQI